MLTSNDYTFAAIANAFQGREKKADKFAKSGMSMEELARLQEEQFAAARERHN